MKSIVEFLVKGNINDNVKKFDIYKQEITNRRYIEITNVKDYCDIVLNNNYESDDAVMRSAEAKLLNGQKIYLMPCYNSNNKKAIGVNYPSKNVKFTFDNKQITLDEFTTEFWKENKWPLE